MSDNEKPSIDEIIGAWKADCGLTKRSDMGTTYVVVPIPDRYLHFLDLIQTLLDHGYEKEYIRSKVFRGKIVLICWPDIITKITDAGLRKTRAITASQWDEAVNKFSDIAISKFVELEKELPVNKVEVKKEFKQQKTKEELLEEVLNPKDRLISTQKIDRSNDTNWELLEELGIESDEAE